MPVSAYFKGSGTKVMKKLKTEYGEKEGESMFYKIANKNNQNPADEAHAKMVAPRNRIGMSKGRKK